MNIFKEATVMGMAANSSVTQYLVFPTKAGKSTFIPAYLTWNTAQPPEHSVGMKKQKVKLPHLLVLSQLPKIISSYVLLY